MKLIIPATITASELTDYNVDEGDKLVPFDQKIISQAEQTNYISYTVEPGTVIEGIAFFNVQGSSIDIVVTDPTDGEVYSETIDLVLTENVIDGYTYCFSPVLTEKAVVKTDIPPYGDAEIQITINAGATTDTAAVGEIVMGKVRSLGGTQYGAGIEIVDYSIKETDEWGNYYITERAFSKRIPMDVVIENTYLGYLKQTLEDYRATPVVCIPTEADNLVGPLLTYGFYKSARTVVSYPNHSILTIEWEGLT